jgi:hypothetical protein
MWVQYYTSCAAKTVGVGWHDEGSRGMTKGAGAVQVHGTGEALAPATGVLLVPESQDSISCT